ncbi:hypothetical protein RNF90_000091 [Shigella flexneri]|nr:hypothetical protein [Shigella flexneri]
MIDSVLALLEGKIPETRRTLLQHCMHRLYQDFKCEQLETFCSTMLSGADEQYDLNELDIILTNGCIELYKQQLLAFGIRVNEGHLSLDSLKYLHALASTLLDLETHDDTALLLAIVEDEDYTVSEALAECARHIYGTDTTNVTPLIGFVHSSLLPRIQQVLTKKLEKDSENLTDEENVHIPENIRRRIRVLDGMYPPVFKQYIEEGGTVGVTLDLLMTQCGGQLAAIRQQPYEYTQELIAFALASDLDDTAVLPILRELITTNFPMAEESKEALRALSEFVSRHGDPAQV